MTNSERMLFLPAESDRTFQFLGTTYSVPSTRVPRAVYAVAVLDQLGRILLGRQLPRSVPNFERGTIAVAKIDHLGDVMMATPFLAELRRQLPHARVILVVGSWCQALAELLKASGLCADYVLYDSWGLNTGATVRRRIRRNIVTFRDALARIRSQNVDCYVDLRPYSPNSLLVGRLARVPFRVGFGLRGLSYTLDRVIPFTSAKSYGQMFLDALPLLGLRSVVYEGPEALVPSGVVVDDLGVPSEPYLVAQPGSRSPLREATVEGWRAVLPLLSEQHPIVLLGGRGEAERFRWVESLVPRGRLINLIGRTTLPQLFEVIRRSAGGVTVDSFAAHVLLGYRKPSIVFVSAHHTPRASFPEQCPLTVFVEREAAPPLVSQAVDRLFGLLAPGA